jgi:transcriptional regulator with XRE-family HTH domain
MQQAVKDIVKKFDVSKFSSPGQLIKYKRIQMGYSQKETAKKVGMTASGLSKVESGAHFLPRNLLELTQFLKIDATQLLHLKSKKHKIVEKSSFEKFKTEFPDWKEIMQEAIREMQD